jgi:hypothetical protein
MRMTRHVVDLGFDSVLAEAAPPANTFGLPDPGNERDHLDGLNSVTRSSSREPASAIGR